MNGSAVRTNSRTSRAVRNRIPVQAVQIPVQTGQIPVQTGQIPVQAVQIPVQTVQSQTETAMRRTIFSEQRTETDGEARPPRPPSLQNQHIGKSKYVTKARCAKATNPSNSNQRPTLPRFYLTKTR